MGANGSILNQVSTDLDNPPAFAKAPSQRPIDAKAQQHLHPDLKPLELEVEAPVAYAAVVKLCKEHFKDVSEDSEQLQVEAVDTTKLMGFKDDVVVRVTTTGSNRCRVDMRSASRVGKSDLGKNAARVNSFFHNLAASVKL
mmetsp:Transcript_29140/g.82161  ORF Transcript_29140/g.82161 Transcript_29140/m.82161 type:complete len:141 (+) Transcript_29140:282-704(+)|eukprot:CAMPEP_0117684612 /NCGR_PEP_ID=MMETSP0804-20121206/21209_1 /TAXON_ID=1074897 /ORGANISM="Tetraselmis astigmatica, Strain CCMP880" /LENGTH=140 /DNA_ID=CAMNT_0005495649 /DNA_START=200 /DNA_END=622 /DNA_ORIENTATION=+